MTTDASHATKGIKRVNMGGDEAVLGALRGISGQEDEAAFRTLPRSCLPAASHVANPFASRNATRDASPQSPSPC